MNFGVEIRNTVTGRAVTLIGKQAVADFLAGVDASEWGGYKCLGELPPATQITTVPAPILDLSVEPVVGERKTFTFDQLVDVGRASGCQLYGDKQMPWSFSVEGIAVTHENDECYIICGVQFFPTENGHFKPGDLLVIDKGVASIERAVDPILPSLTEALDAFHDGAETDPPKGADSIVLFEPVDHSDTPLVGAADPFADANPHAASVVGIVGDLTLSVGDSGAGDSYLPADAAGEQA